MAKTGVINARVEQSVRDRLKRYCEEREIKMAVIVERALSQWLDKNEHNAHNTTQHNAHSETQCTQEDIEVIVEKKLEAAIKAKALINQQALDERLAAAIEPLWGAIDDLSSFPKTPPSESTLEPIETTSQDKSPLSPP